MTDLNRGNSFFVRDSKTGRLNEVTIKPLAAHKKFRISSLIIEINTRTPANYCCDEFLKVELLFWAKIRSPSKRDPIIGSGHNEFNKYYENLEVNSNFNRVGAVSS